MTKQTIEIGGMSCGHCVMSVRNVLSQLQGVTADEVRVGMVKVSYDEAVVSAENIADAIRDAGYDVRATTVG